MTTVESSATTFQTEHFGIDGAQLARVLGNAVLATEKGDLRPALTCVRVTFARANGKATLETCATDSYWLLREMLELGPDDRPDVTWTAYAPAADLAAIIKAGKDRANRGAAVTVEYDPLAAHGHLTFTVGNVRVVTGSTDVGYPTVDRFFTDHVPGPVGSIGWRSDLLAKICKVRGDYSGDHGFKVTAGETELKPAHVKWLGSTLLEAVVMPYRMP